MKLHSAVTRCTCGERLINAKPCRYCLAMAKAKLSRRSEGTANAEKQKAA